MLKNASNIQAYEYKIKINTEIKDLISHIQTVFNDVNYNNSKNNLYLDLSIQDFPGLIELKIAIKHTENEYIKISLERYTIRKEDLWLVVDNLDSIEEQEKYNKKEYDEISSSITKIKDDFDQINWNGLLIKLANLQKEYIILGSTYNKDHSLYGFRKIEFEDEEGFIYYLNNDEHLLSYKDGWFVSDVDFKTFLFNQIELKWTKVKLLENVENLIQCKEVKEVTVNNQSLYIRLTEYYFARFNDFANNYHQFSTIVKKIQEAWHPNYDDELKINLTTKNINSFLKVLSDYNEYKKEH